MTKKRTPAAEAKGSGATDGLVLQQETVLSPAKQQLKLYERALQLFAERKHEEALQQFREVARGPESSIADKARSYSQVCERRMGPAAKPLVSAEDHFNFGVERLNAGELEAASRHLQEALTLSPRADHVLYTLALCCGFAGDSDGACANLKRAIELEPRNRILARQDADFSALAAQYPGLRALLSTDSSGRY